MTGKKNGNYYCRILGDEMLRFNSAKGASLIYLCRSTNVYSAQCYPIHLGWWSSEGIDIKGSPTRTNGGGAARMASQRGQAVVCRESSFYV